MAWLIIREKGQPARAFPLARKRYTVGRGERADLLLPNVSVSRAHFRITKRASKVELEDLGSQNGTMINGRSVEFHDLITSDVIDAGKYSMIFVGDDMNPAMYGNQLLEDMPGYTFSTASLDSTYELSPALLARMRQLQEVADKGGVVSTDDAGQWLIGDDIVCFGSRGRIPVQATFARGVVAEVFWDETQHVLRRRSRLVKITVNGEGISERALRIGDTIRLGGSTFRYEMLD